MRVVRAAAAGGGAVSLVGFRANNHPQQTAKRGALVAVDDRTVHPDDFAQWHIQFGFTVDAAASANNARLPRYWTVDDDALLQDWTHERVWCNPPYSNLLPWVDKAHMEWTGGCELIVMLLPANRTEQRWWQQGIEPYRDQSDRLLRVRIEFLPGRLRFIMPGYTDVEPNQRPPFGCCLAIWGEHS